MNILSMTGGYPSYQAVTERSQPIGWVERVFSWIGRREVPVREELWLSEVGILWFRESDGSQAPGWISRALDTRLRSDEARKNYKRSVS